MILDQCDKSGVGYTSGFRILLTMNLSKLRELLREPIDALKERCTHETLPDLCSRLGLASLEDVGSKRDRLRANFAALPDSELPAVAERLLAQHPPSAAARNAIQDLLWDSPTVPEIQKRFRREVARAIENDLYLDSRRFDELLDRLWDIGEGDIFAALGWSQRDDTLRGQIQRHVHQNPGDWDAEMLFDRLGAFTASDRRFAVFLEGLASCDVRPDVGAQRRFVDVVNRALRGSGVELRETGSEGGYPVFEVVSTHGVTRGRIKNLIFASPTKPDLRFRDAIDNDIEIVSNADDVLVYDRPLGADGLLWRDLQSWWADNNSLSDNPEKAKRDLYRRLKASLPASSPPQRALFEAFHKTFAAAIPALPALLPEVWLHWDPRTVRERGRDALLRFRMDFLMLLPAGVRVVIEVDGKQHYSSNGTADVAKYAALVAADRELKLVGYEVYRFGAAELQDPEASLAAVRVFFESLFKRYGVRDRDA